MGSPKSLTLLQDNIPDDNCVSTSIINIWAFVPEKEGGQSVIVSHMRPL